MSRLADLRAGEPTLASTWEAFAGRPVTDELLEWPPDVFALMNVLFDRSETFRFSLTPVGAWPPDRFSDWPGAVKDAGRRWGAWVEDRRAAIPELLSEEWSAFREVEELPLEELARGEHSRACEALQSIDSGDIPERGRTRLWCHLGRGHERGCTCEGRPLVACVVLL